MKAADVYTSGDYLERNALWHVDESPWKAEQVLRALRRTGLTPRLIGDVGCGAGEVLHQLYDRMDSECRFVGYEISPQAYELCLTRAGDRLTFKLGDITERESEYFDLMLVMDVLEHLEDYFSFLRAIKDRASYKIFHFPLDLSMQSIVRRGALLRLRGMYRHLHYFSKETALATLEDAGYEILDHFYTQRAIDLPTSVLTRKLLRLPRKVAFALRPDFAVRTLGGFSLLVVAR